MSHHQNICLCLLFMLVGVADCSLSAELPPELGSVSDADRIVATNTVAGTNKNACFTFTGKEVRSVRRAVSSATPEKIGYIEYFDWDLKFYTGTNLLTVIHLGKTTFWTQDWKGHYQDKTDVLGMFYKGLEMEKLITR